jgi:hypothetical protein
VICAHIRIEHVGLSCLLLNLDALRIGLVEAFSGFATQTFGVYFSLLRIRLRTGSAGLLLLRRESHITCVLPDVSGAMTVSVCASPPPVNQYNDDDDNDNNNYGNDKRNCLLGSHGEPFHFVLDG